ncbi:nuclear transport factor 2 family protein [Leeuwenhoekiella aequorea]|uniref:nuclear transport factor 2 family protein n=1 Tax=Leeuwenhoekiella aequorea TaxID=283736 RepID=UPI00352BDBFA|tara:strand:+ start:15658 stop:15972 length:315 start_codon:yes stop_codon:yes gene_type:complete
MKLPQTIEDLIDAQNRSDNTAYMACFSEDATVKDEGKTYRGKEEIRNWISKANESFMITMKPLQYNVDQAFLKAEISGNFSGSPLVLSYHFKFINDKVNSLIID